MTGPRRANAATWWMAATIGGYPVGTGKAFPIRLVVYPDAHHDFDVPGLETQVQFFGHRLEFNQPASDRSIDAVFEFLDATIGGKEELK